MDKFLYDRDHRHERVNGLSRLLHERTYFQRNDKPKQWLPSLYLLIVQNQVAFCKRNSILKKKKKKNPEISFWYTWVLTFCSYLTRSIPSQNKLVQLLFKFLYIHTSG